MDYELQCEPEFIQKECSSGHSKLYTLQCRNDITPGGGGQVYRLARRLASHFTTVRTRRQVLPQHEARYRRPRRTNHRSQERL